VIDKLRYLKLYGRNVCSQKGCITVFKIIGFLYGEWTYKLSNHNDHTYCTKPLQYTSYHGNDLDR